MRNIVVGFVVVTFFLLLVPLVKGQAQGAFLKTDKSTYTLTNGGTGNVDVVVDAGSDTIRSADVVLLYDATVLEATSFAPGTFFPTVANNLTSGKVTLTAYFNDAATSKSGTGIIGTVTFKGLKDGTSNLTFDCGTATGSKINKNSADVPNIIVCTQNFGGVVTVGAGGAAATPTPGAGGTAATPTPGAGSSTLPQSGFFDNTLKFAVAGMILLFIGLGLKLVL